MLSLFLLYKKYSFSMLFLYLRLQADIFSHPYYSSTQITPSPPSPLDFYLTSQVTKNALFYFRIIEQSSSMRNFPIYNKYNQRLYGRIPKSSFLLCHSFRRAGFDTDLRSVFNRQIYFRSKFTGPS